VNTKHCVECHEHKQLTEFYKHSGMVDGVYNKCKLCQRGVQRVWYDINKKTHLSNVANWKKQHSETVQVQQQKYRDDNRDHINERMRASRINNPELFSIQSKKYYYANKEVYRQNAVRRRLIVKAATPKWADFSKMRQIYKQAHQLTEDTGIAYEVDHIVPLNNLLVCGLHCDTNLQILTADANRHKGNHYS